MNQLNKIYEHMIKSWNGVISPTYQLFLNMGGVETPIKVDDKEVYLGTNEVLNGCVIGKVIFHPACESIMSKETEIFKVIRKLSAARLYQVVQPIAQVIFAVAGKKSAKTLSGKMVEALNPFKAASKEMKEDVLEVIKGIGIVLDSTGIDNRLISFNMIKGGKDANDNHIYYTATPTYPFYNELTKFMSQNAGKQPTDKVVFNGQKVQYGALSLVAAMFELVFPSVIDPTVHSYSVTTADCARLISYLQSYSLVASEVNSFIGKFRKDFDSIGIYGIDLNWVGDLENLGELKGLIPPMEYNNYNTAPDTSRVQQGVVNTDPYAALLNTSRAPAGGTPAAGAQPTAGQPPAPATRPGESYFGCEYLSNSGLYEFRYNQPDGGQRVVTLTEDGRIQSESYFSAQQLAMRNATAGMNNGQSDLAKAALLLGMMNGMTNMNGQPSNVAPLVGMTPNGFYRDAMTGQLMPIQPNNGMWGTAPQTNDPWGNTAPMSQPTYPAVGGWSNWQ